MRRPLNPKEIETVIMNAPALSAFAAIGKDPTLPDNEGFYKFGSKVEMTGDKHAVRAEVIVTTGIEELKLVRIIQNETRMSGIEEIKVLCEDANKYFIASMFTSFPAPDEQLSLFDGEEGV